MTCLLTIYSDDSFKHIQNEDDICLDDFDDDFEDDDGDDDIYDWDETTGDLTKKYNAISSGRVMVSSKIMFGFRFKRIYPFVINQTKKFQNSPNLKHLHTTR